MQRDEFVMDILADPGFFSAFEEFLISPFIAQNSQATKLPIPWSDIRAMFIEHRLAEIRSGSANAIIPKLPDPVTISPYMMQYIRDICIAVRHHARVRIRLNYA